jgi:hypothetical protein
MSQREKKTGPGVHYSPICNFMLLQAQARHHIIAAPMV